MMWTMSRERERSSISCCPATRSQVESASTERRRRLSASLDYVEQRLKACHPDDVGVAEGHPTTTLEQETAILREQLKSSAVLDQDVIETGVDLFDRIEQHLEQRARR